MNAPATIQDSASTSGLLQDQSNFVFVGNSNAFAIATYSSSTDAYEVHDLPGLPGVLITPKALFGIDTELFSRTVDLQLAAGVGNLDGYLFRLLSYLSTKARPEDAARQTARVTLLVTQAAWQARETFDRTSDMGYSTDLRSSYFSKRLRSTLKVKVSDRVIQMRYNKIIDDAIHQAFAGVTLSNTHRHWLEEFIVDEVREVFSPDACTIRICCLSGPERQPTLGEFYVDGFIADHLKIEHDPWIPMRIEAGEGVVLTSSCSTTMGSAASVVTDRSFKHNFQTTLARLGKQSDRSAMPLDTEAEVMGQFFGKETDCVFWHQDAEHRNPPPFGFESASSEALLEIAIRFAQAKSGPGHIGDDKNITSTFTAAR